MTSSWNKKKTLSCVCHTNCVLKVTVWQQCVLLRLHLHRTLCVCVCVCVCEHEWIRTFAERSSPSSWTDVVQLSPGATDNYRHFNLRKLYPCNEQCACVYVSYIWKLKRNPIEYEDTDAGYYKLLVVNCSGYFTARFWSVREVQLLYFVTWLA